MTHHLVNTAITTIQQLGLQQSIEAVNVWFMQPWIAKRLRLPPPGNDWHHLGTHLAEYFCIVHRRGVVVGWVLRNGGGVYGLALWSVTKGWVGGKFMAKMRYVTLEWPLILWWISSCAGMTAICAGVTAVCACELSRFSVRFVPLIESYSLMLTPTM